MIAYDIGDDRNRRQAFKILKNYGVRVQYSVFECMLDEYQFTELRMQLAQVIGDEDSLRLYPLCKWCRNLITWQGKGTPVDDQGFVIL